MLAPTVAQVVRVERLDRRVGADRHELRRLDDAVGQRQAAEPRPRPAVGRWRGEDLERRGARDGDGGHGLPTPEPPALAPASSHSGTISGSARRGGGIS